MKKKRLNELVFRTKEGQEIEIPVEGSLGLFALGDIGLLAWRQKKLQHNELMMKKLSERKNIKDE